MPPRTRAAKPTKSFKENVGVALKTKQKSSSKVTKPTRKVLGDKTNSASDDNTSVEIVEKGVKKSTTSNKDVKTDDKNYNPYRPRRDRRLPSRFAENQLLNNLSNKSKENTPVASLSKNATTQDSVSNDSTLVSPFKTPSKVTENSLVANRPRRICRLPSKFEDHSISPAKFIPVQPFHASTPIVQKGTEKNTKKIESTPKTTQLKESNRKKPTEKELTKSKDKKEKTKPTITQTARTQRHSQRKTAVDSSKEKNVASTKEVRVISSQITQNLSPNKTFEEINKHSTKDSKNLNPEKSKKQTPTKSKTSPDTNNNPKGRTLRARKVVDIKTKLSPNKKVVTSPVKNTSLYKPLQRPINRNFSFKVLEDNDKNESNEDVYEFTYDPNEEPTPKKKKRKVTKRKPAKPKTVVLKNNYEQNVNKALASLKSAVAQKQNLTVKTATTPNPIPIEPDKGTKPQTQDKTIPEILVNGTKPNVPQGIPQIQRNVASKIIIGNMASSQNQNITTSMQQNAPINIINNKNVTNAYSRVTNQSYTKLPEPNKSVRIEDIAADFEPSINEDLNYSPVNSPRPVTPVPQNRSIRINEHDPLNLRDNASFFDDQPVASSSMNMSVRHPHASPWRVEFENLPIRWHVNSYVKPNMTPAVECSFVNFEDKNKKKHVYTNMVPESNEALPEIVEKNAPNLVQTSIISFIKEVIERSSTKKKRERSVTPATPNLFTDVTNKTPEKTAEKVIENKEATEKEANKVTRQLFTPKKNKAKLTDSLKDSSSDKENSVESSKGQKRKNVDEITEVPSKTPCKDKDNTFFGFDDSENIDQENVLPKKNVEVVKRSLRSRGRGVLKEINEQKPTRAVIPLAAKTRNAEVERLYEEMKSASDAPVFPEKEPIISTATTAIEPIEEEFDSDSPSVHLFEDIELVHHLKPHRKSYGKAKKVSFQQDSSDNDPRVGPCNSDQEDLGDLTYDPAMPFVEEKRTKKKITKKQKLSKKEAEEVEAWAAGFNSMCEDVEGFELLVE